MLDRPPIYRAIERTIGTDHIVQFREDFKWLFYEKSEKFNRWQESSPALKQQAADGLTKARSTEWNSYALWLGLLGLVVGLIGVTPFATGFTLLSLVVSGFGGLHKVSVDMLVFHHPYQERRSQRLKFMSAWNRGVMTSWKAVLVLPLGLLIRTAPQGYKLGLWVIEDLIEDLYE
jgi:hypothetical protein